MDGQKSSMTHLHYNGRRSAHTSPSKGSTPVHNVPSILVALNVFRIAGVSVVALEAFARARFPVADSPVGALGDAEGILFTHLGSASFKDCARAISLVL